jgi:uncharacterized repeat protein (TIGR04042 family)
MPETYFIVQLPDGTLHSCYSPSSIVKNYFKPGASLTASEFLRSSRLALTEASERVRAKFGFSCSAAADSLSEIEAWAGALPPEAPLIIQKI